MEELQGAAVHVNGKIVAWFSDPDLAEEWATEHHFGQWLMSGCTIPNKPPITPEQWELAKIEGEKMMAKFDPNPSFCKD